MSQTPNQALLNSGFNFTPTIHHDTYPFIDPTNPNTPPVPPGRSVFITGASKGIGRAVALSYARAGFSHIGIGARSDLSSLTTALRSAATAAGHPAPTVAAVPMDVTSRESVAAAAAAIGAAFAGTLDVLVANAGTCEPWVRVSEADPDAWWRTYEVNMRGTFLAFRFFAPLVLASRLRTVLLVSSLAATTLSTGGASAYRGTKLAMLRFAETVVLEEADAGLLAYSVHPGGVVTDMAEVMEEGLRKRVLIDTVDMSADSIVWLTRERREWLAGRFVSCNWDMEEFERKRDEIEKGDLLKVRMAVQLGN